MINVCYCGNKYIFHGIVLSVLSMLEHTSEPVSIYLLTMDLSDESPRYMPISERQIEILRKIVKRQNPENEAYLEDVTDLYRKCFAGIKTSDHYTPYTMTRLFLDILDLTDKMLYLDVDTMFVGDVKELWDTDIKSYEFAVTRDYMGQFWIRRSYFNAGVILFNIAEAKRTGLFKKCRDYIAKKKPWLSDQTALNKNATERLLYHNYRFNEQRNIRSDTVIKHFCRGIKWYGPFLTVYNYKQWERDKVRKKLKTDAFDHVYELFDRYDEELSIMSECTQPSASI